MYRHPSEDFRGDDACESATEQEPIKENQQRPGRRHRDDAGKEEGPDCQACRRKKAKCTRRQPCSQCVKNETECVYDEAKNKPGMRTGAIEHLTQRLSTLENMFLGQGLVWQQVWRHLESLGQAGAPDASSSSSYTSPGSLQDSTVRLKDSLTAVSRGQNGDTCAAASAFDPFRPSKRRRIGAEVELNHHTTLPKDQHGLPPRDLVDTLVEIYFERIHPWIPMLHVRKFRQQLLDPVGRSEMSTVLHAITSLCVRFSDDPWLGDPAEKEELAKKSRETVILRSMESFSVKNLQALIICAFDIIGVGRGPSAWSIVGSMARTAEQLQLSVEGEGRPSRSGMGAASNGVITRLAFLPPPRDWSDEEERRRVFWNIFMMDRFCSISTGWNLSLTSADARRRLPCEGGLWEAGEPLEVPTPYFGLSESDQTSISNAGGGSTGTNAKYEDAGCLGGFAYCIEATESLSQVTSFALQPAQDVQMWLMRFKELDLRLMQWKVFLPQRWREACAVNADGNMDPNLTLSHITHNTAVALLHQSIAYPSTTWPSPTGSARPPSQSSAEICLSAATEVATIARHFLAGTRILANHQFAFCLFVCGRMLLAHVAYYQVSLMGVFDVLVDSLREISNRWNGVAAASSSSSKASADRDTNLASKFASRLSEARELGPTTLDIRQAAYLDDDTHGVSGSEKMPKEARNPVTDSEHVGGFAASATTPQTGEMPYPMVWDEGGFPAPQMPASETSPDSISLAFPPLPQSFQAPSALQSRAPSPIVPADGAYQQHPLHVADPSTLPGQLVPPAESGQTFQDFEDISSYIDSTLLPDRRISVYSQLASVEKPQYPWHAKP